MVRLGDGEWVQVKDLQPGDTFVRLVERDDDDCYCCASTAIWIMVENDPEDYQRQGGWREVKIRQAFPIRHGKELENLTTRNGEWMYRLKEAVA